MTGLKLAVKDIAEVIDDLYWLLLVCENETVVKVMSSNVDVWWMRHLPAVWLWINTTGVQQLCGTVSYMQLDCMCQCGSVNGLSLVVQDDPCCACSWHESATAAIVACGWPGPLQTVVPCTISLLFLMMGVHNALCLAHYTREPVAVVNCGWPPIFQTGSLHLLSSDNWLVINKSHSTPKAWCCFSCFSDWARFTSRWSST